MGKFIKKIKRSQPTFTGKKAQLKQMRKVMTKAQQEYWKMLKNGTISEPNEMVNDDEET